jgi:hypothetical protein
MIIESMRAGIVLESQDQKRSSTQENPLALVFPHFAGKLPDLDSEERIEWSIKHSNGMEIKMYDLQSVHGLARSDKDKTHAIHIHPAGKLYNSQRKIFGLKTLANGEKIDGLLGWVEAGKTTLHCGSLLILPHVIDLPQAHMGPLSIPRFSACSIDTRVSMNNRNSNHSRRVWQITESTLSSDLKGNNHHGSKVYNCKLAVSKLSVFLFAVRLG